MVEKRLKANKRRQEIIELIKKIGIINLNQSDLARQYGVTAQQISKDMKKVYTMIDVQDHQKMRVTLDDVLWRSIREPHKVMLNTKDERTKVLASKTVNENARKYHEFLEAWGLKNKIPEKTELSGQLGIFDIFKNLKESPDESQEERRKNVKPVKRDRASRAGQD